MSDGLAAVDAVVLAGGRGTRLAGVLPDTPKILAPVNGEPYIAFLLDWLAGSGLRRVILSLGFLADQIEAWLDANPRSDLDLRCAREPAAAGTAGALRYASDLVHSDPVLVMNGDSFVDADFGDFLLDFRVSGAAASVLCARVPDTARYGRVHLNEAGWIRQFAEKQPDSHAEGYINAGVYLFSRQFYDDILAREAVSLEHDIFATAQAGTIRGFAESGTFHDIGTPESLAEAAAVLSPFRTSQPKEAVS